MSSLSSVFFWFNTHTHNTHMHVHTHKHVQAYSEKVIYDILFLICRNIFLFPQVLKTAVPLTIPKMTVWSQLRLEPDRVNWKIARWWKNGITHPSAETCKKWVFLTRRRLYFLHCLLSLTNGASSSLLTLVSGYHLPHAGLLVLISFALLYTSRLFRFAHLSPDSCPPSS